MFLCTHTRITSRKRVFRAIRVRFGGPFWGLFSDPCCDLIGKTRENMQFIVNVILHGKTRVKSELLLDIRKSTAYTHNAALSVVRLSRVLPYISACSLISRFAEQRVGNACSNFGENTDVCTRS